MDKAGKYVLMGFLALAALAAMPAEALMPYTPRSFWDLMVHLEDPFKILEQSPFAAISKLRSESLALARADWKETPKEHLISLDIPGMKRDEVKIEVDQDSRVVRISGERKSEEEAHGDTWHRAERTVGKFLRQFRLPANADFDKIQARLDNGVLRIVVPKSAEEEKREPRLISIAEEEAAGGSANAAGASVDVKVAKDEM